MNITGSVALVTGANRGIGREIAAHLLQRGAAKVYAGARTPSTVDLPGVEPLPLDITDPDSVAAAAAVAQDVTLVVNNAGIFTGAGLLGDRPDLVRLEMDTHYYGTLEVSRAFAPILAANGGGGLVNILSAMSWFSYNGGGGAYSAAKAAAWSLTNSLRVELFRQNTQVTGVLLGMAKTGISPGDYTGPMLSVAEVATATLDGVEAGAQEVLVDEWSAYVKASLAKDPAEFYTPTYLAGEFPL
ncbi:SDR family oxidoreductase [Kineosporia succinea]|uniref:NAD(P)-dependent dehydrogenase (Short-subunit alcohol dehydrogenase family) n=1 Tax=Kineosporia succinea TaxID=84632 RepID=A0ABT9P2M2_9ACTN|nr:SDR family oxidoreductase [Kineosporia succinea]MDP9826908.1 NAD(P)-dependent dehydrogenase (short-subunit alcohol dehydrogenase family) [Kineosporia succinea]